MVKRTITELPALPSVPDDLEARNQLLFGIDDARDDTSYKVSLGDITEVPPDRTTSITVAGHGLPIGALDAPQPIMQDPTTAELSLPSADALDNTRFQVAWMAIEAVDNATLKAFHVAQLESRDWEVFPNASFPLNSYHWLQNDGSVSNLLTSSTRLWVSHPTDQTKILYSYRLFLDNTAGSQTGSLDTRTESRYSEYDASANISAGTAINMNAATAGWTSSADIGNYTAHDARTAATFNDFYPRFLEATVGGIVVPQGVVYRSDSDPAGYVRFSREIINESRIVFRSSLEVVV